MKTSNKILLTLLSVLLATTVFVDFLLKRAYLKINLTDPFKNYAPVAIRPFKYLNIKGGNAYAIEIKQATKLDMKVMTSRKSFLTTAQHGDTLLIKFTVMSSMAMRDPEGLPHGLIISSPEIAEIIAEGSNNIITGWKMDSLKLTLTSNASASINNADLGKLSVRGNQNAVFNFHSENKVQYLDLRLTDSASAFLQGISYSVFNPLLTGDSQLIFNAQSAVKLKANGGNN
ncbi:MAG: hypothetical protein JWR09_3481 [Mucilaginibacter sp.]|nr:hypothetical protein [Mucilaginibacter sp.]